MFADEFVKLGGVSLRRAVHTLHMMRTLDEKVILRAGVQLIQLPAHGKGNRVIIRAVHEEYRRVARKACGRTSPSRREYPATTRFIAPSGQTSAPAAGAGNPPDSKTRSRPR